MSEQQQSIFILYDFDDNSSAFLDAALDEIHARNEAGKSERSGVAVHDHELIKKLRKTHRTRNVMLHRLHCWTHCDSNLMAMQAMYRLINCKDGTVMEFPGTKHYFEQGSFAFGAYSFRIERDGYRIHVQTDNGKSCSTVSPKAIVGRVVVRVETTGAIAEPSRGRTRSRTQRSNLVV